MACIQQCPKCKIHCKEEGDEGKSSRGEYRVYDSLGTPKNGYKDGEFRLIECLSCGYIGHITTWPI